MARIARKTQKIFAGSAGNNGQFGSARLGTFVTSADVEVLQNLAAYSQGWASADVGTNHLPTLEEMQGLNYINTSQLAYLFQMGIPEWDDGTTYYQNSMVMKAGTYQIYGSLTDDNTGNALTDPTNWVLIQDLTNIAVADVSTSTVLATNTTKARALQERLMPVYTFWFEDLDTGGVIASGADCASLMNSCINLASNLSGGGYCEIRLSSKQLTIGSTVNMKKAVWIRGCNVWGSRISARTGFTGVMIACNDNACHNWGLCNLRIDGLNVTGVTHGVEVNRSAPTDEFDTHGVMRDVLVQNCKGDGVMQGINTREMHMDNVESRFNGGNGLTMLGTDCWVTDCSIHDNQLRGIWHRGGSNHITATKCWLNGNNSGNSTKYANFDFNGYGAALNQYTKSTVCTNCYSQDAYGHGWNFDRAAVIKLAACFSDRASVTSSNATLAGSGIYNGLNIANSRKITGDFTVFERSFQTYGTRTMLYGAKLDNLDACTLTIITEDVLTPYNFANMSTDRGNVFNVNNKYLTITGTQVSILPTDPTENLVLPDGGATIAQRLGYLFGPKSGPTIADERFGVKCDGTTNDIAALITAYNATPTGAKLVIPWGATGVCRIDGAVGFDLLKSIILDCSSGVTFLFTDANARYLRLLADDVTVLQPKVDGNNPVVRTAFGGGIHVKGKRCRVFQGSVKNVAGTLYMVTGAEDCQFDQPYGEGSLADGFHVSNNDGACKRISVNGGIMKATGDDAWSIVAYNDGTHAVHEDITFNGFTADGAAAAGITVAGVLGARVNGKVRGSSGPYASRFELDTSYTTFSNIDLHADVNIRDSQNAGGLVGKGNYDSTFDLTSYRSGLAGSGSFRQGFFVGSNGSTNQTERCTVRLRAYGAGSNGIDVNGTKGLTLYADVSNSGAHGLNVASANNTGLHIAEITARNNSQSSAGTYNNIFIVTGPSLITVGSVNSIDDQVTPTISECMRVTGTNNIVVGAYNGVKNGVTTRIQFDAGGGANTNARFLAPCFANVTQAYTIPTLAAGAAGAIQTVTVPGVALGTTHVELSFDKDLGGVMLQGWVSATDTVKFMPFNPTGSSIASTGAGNVRVMATSRV